MKQTKYRNAIREGSKIKIKKHNKRSCAERHPVLADLHKFIYYDKR